MVSIRSKVPRSSADSSGFANHRRQIARSIVPDDQRFQISAITTAAISSPTNRMMMVPMPCSERRNGDGIGVLGPNTLH